MPGEEHAAPLASLEAPPGSACLPRAENRFIGNPQTKSVKLRARTRALKFRITRVN